MKLSFTLLLLIPFFLLAQPKKILLLSAAYDLALKNYPLVKQRELLKQTAAINIENLGKGFLPQVNLSGQAGYQSDVTAIKIPLPGVNIPSPSKDQYRIVADINQLLYDGNNIKVQKDIQRLNENTEQQKIEIELYRIKDRINQLFLGVLFLDEQLKQVDLVKNDLSIGIKKTEAQVNNGVAFRSNLNVLKAELLKTDQRTIELTTTRKGLTDVLSLFIGETLPDEVVLEKPVITATPAGTDIQRPELKLYSVQEKLLNGQNKLIDSRTRPRASFYLESGYGRPGLNLLKNDFAFFYTTGVRLNWAFGGLYTQKKEKQLIELGKRSIGIQKEIFLLNTNTVLKQQEAEISKMKKLIAKDYEIIELRVKVKDAAKVQLDNGVITANDYLREVNAEDQARQSLITHQVQLLQAQINYQTISGKQ